MDISKKSNNRLPKIFLIQINCLCRLNKFNLVMLLVYFTNHYSSKITAVAFLQNHWGNT